eukprot:NODE_14587_length_1099_cov_4.231481.p1 GENE.NODE_14587_length_1099_cov_4.231481~~NODE_14587_length_1099_cov_4.231481.p1  ORF type:complete len:232 (-),score=13.45 NODE_14587_length_1099_cov_4.231481:265-960(-)
MRPARPPQSEPQENRDGRTLPPFCPHGDTMYDLINAHPEATPVQIRQAYRRTARLWHPDKVHPDDKALAEERFKQIGEAYEVMHDADQRQLYDLYLRCRSQGYIEVTDDTDPSAPGVRRVRVDTWANFHRMFGHASRQDIWKGGVRPAYYDEDANDADAPLTMIEGLAGLLAGFALLATFWRLYMGGRQQDWLNALPPDLWHAHIRYNLPSCGYLAPMFFSPFQFSRHALG